MYKRNESEGERRDGQKGDEKDFSKFYEREEMLVREEDDKRVIGQS